MANYGTLILGIAQFLIAKKLLEAQTDARERLSVIAEESLALAEELFASEMELRAYDSQVYDEVKNLPSYDVCINNVNRGKMTGHFTQLQAMKVGAFGHSRYNCGSREKAIMNALSGALIEAGEVSATAYNFEEAVQDSYDILKWGSIAGSATFSTPTSKVYGSIGQQMVEQHQFYSKAANGSITGLSYTVKSGINNYRYNKAQEMAKTDRRLNAQAARGV